MSTPTAQRVDPVVSSDPKVPAPRWIAPRWIGAVRSGWIPSVLVSVAAASALRFYGVPFATTAVFAAYLLLCVVLPGTLVWRAVNRGGGSFVADVAAGTAVGYAGEVLAYIPARAVGLPLLVLAWPVGAVLVLFVIPRLRGRVPAMKPKAQRPPVLWCWAVAGTVAVLVLWSCKFFRLHGLTWPAYAAPDLDSPFHLALIGEAKHHMPMQIPWVDGEPVHYHWFVYADMAATSWVTGIEPQLLLLRLSPLPMLACFTVLIAILARKLFGHWWTGVAAVVGTLFVLAPGPYGWEPSAFSTYFAFSPFEDGSSLRLQLWTSPTQTFGAMLFVPVVLVLVDLLRGRAGGLRAWGLFAALSCAVMGAKATFLPLLLAGLLVVVGVHFLVHRRLHRTAVAAAAVTLACLLCAQWVLFGGASQGLGWQPLATMQAADVAYSTGFRTDGRPWRFALLVLLTGWCWMCMWAGCAGLLRRRRLLAPEILLLLGMGAAGIGAVTLLGQPGGSQSYFLQSARPYLALAAVGGLAALLDGRSLTRRRGVALIGAVLTGAVIIKIIRMSGDTTTPTVANSGGWTGLATALAWPYLAAFGAAVAVAALVFSIWRTGGSRGTAGALVVCLLAGFGTATAYSNVARMVRESSTHGWRAAAASHPIVTAGTLEAGRWLRANSRPDDLVATNAHCLPTIVDECVNLHFSVAAYTERRILVEGWGFTARVHVRAEELKIWHGRVPYWKPETLAANDAAFTTPSADTMAALRDRYGVRWLFVDGTRPHSSRLAGFAVLRHRSGDCSVYEL